MKQVLVLNSGSSTMKYQLIDIETESVLASGNVECIGEGMACARHISGDIKHTDAAQIVDDHAAALQQILESFDQFGPKLDTKNLVAIGHRVVHGGTKFDRPVLIDDQVEAIIDELSALAPLHNPPALTGVRVARSIFKDIPHVAVFDTAFHQTLPPANYTYAIDRLVAEKYNIRRYGFHGTSHEYVASETAKLLDRPLEELNLITLHLGSGSSVAAIKQGKSFDTSMGMTPLAGLVMNTRVGDIDPAVIFHLYRSGGMSIDEIDQLLNKESGTFGMNDGVVDMREIMDEFDRGDEQARRVIDIIVRRIQHYIGAYFVELGHVDAIVFTAGVGENNGSARREILKGLEEPLGIKIDLVANMKNDGFIIGAEKISADDSRIPVLVIQTNEELSIARQATKTVENL
ncbi:acetate kinase [Candidatus Saccharibacteria bacterium]|nr:acetate kinase [Candidatus Saccharibacteria bacterium]